MCMGFLYTVWDRVLSACGFNMVSRNGIAPSCWLFSTLILMAGSTLLIRSRKFCLCSSHWMTIHISKPKLGVVAVLRATLLKCSMYGLATMGLTGDPIAAPSTCSQNWP